MAYLIPGSEQLLPALTPRDLVFFLMGRSRTHYTHSLTGFMTDFASSFTDFSGGELLATQTPEAFVSSLIRLGWLERV